MELQQRLRIRACQVSDEANNCQRITMENLICDRKAKTQKTLGEDTVINVFG